MNEALPVPAYRLPLPQAAQWQTALNCAERDPHKPVMLDGRTVLAVHDAVERAVLAERERCAQIAFELGGNRCDVVADAIRGDGNE